LFLTALLAFSDYLGLIPVSLFGIKFYGADFLIILLGISIPVYGFKFLLNTNISLGIFLFLLFGFFSLLYGYLEGHELKAVIGEFRRLFFYSTAFAFTWTILNDPKRTIKTQRIIYIAVIPVVMLSILRAWKGVSWHPNYSEGDVRAVSYASAAVLFWVFFDSSTRLLFTIDWGKMRLKYIPWMIIASFTLLISNYRTLWILPLAGFLGLLLFSWQRGYLRHTRIIFSVILIAGTVFSAIYLLRISQNPIYLLIEQKFYEKVLGFQFTNSFRYFIWSEAWNRFSTSRLIGVGIGDRLESIKINSLGNWYTSTSDVHNILLGVLYQTGVIGIVIFLIPQVLFVAYVWSNIRNLSQQWVQPTIAAFFTYLSMFTLGMFEPFFTIPSVVVLFYIIMGITVRFVYWGRRDNKPKEILVENRDF
jgi:hypothetical protein